MDPRLLGALAAALAFALDPSPVRKVAEAGIALGLLAWRYRGVGAAVGEGLDSLGLNADNPLVQPDGGQYARAWAAGVPGDVVRFFEEAPPVAKPGQTREELNQESLAWLWRTSS